jgi:choline dehydrogenase
MSDASARTADYIVIGAGSAGCVMASRLSEDAGTSVLLLEAGGSDDHLTIRMPLGFLSAMMNPRFAWGFMSEPEPALGGRPLWVPRGRILADRTRRQHQRRGHHGR